MISYKDMTEGQKKICDDTMDLYAEWLNRWHAASGDLFEGKPIVVTRENYFEWDDPPHLLVESDEAAGWFYTVLVFTLNPYHDEGGPCLMTVYVDEDGKIRHMTQCFDTMFSTIYDDTAGMQNGEPFQTLPE